jgi:putative transposase
MSFYRRRLPHWQPKGAAIFLTWRLYGSLPRTKIASSATEGQRFVLLDRQLDAATSGPMFLQNPQVADAVIQTFFLAANEWDLYEPLAWVVMSNHVHLLIQPHKSLSAITRAVKKTSARRANLILGRSGLPFWQDESFDHWVRNGKQFDRIVQYIESNPVKAGLANTAETWRWSSAFAGGQVGNLPH